MLDPKQIDDLARRLAEYMPKGAQVLQEDLGRSVRSTLEAGLGRLNLVTREEFDVQAAVLARSRARLEAMERRLAELEAAEAAATTAAPAARPKRGKAPSKDSTKEPSQDREPDEPTGEAPSA